MTRNAARRRGWETNRLATVPRHAKHPGGRHRAQVQPGWVRMNVMLAAMIWWLGIGGITG